ncbi:MAG: hypothetical protein NW204_10105 [Xanthomonadaceae bacterium]|nr:hypothetical protein [Xanthomonadaceae bacterium]
MRETLTPELRQLLQTMAQAHATQAIPFIVTADADCRIAEVVPFPIDNAFEIIHAVSGRMTAAQALALAQHPQIERIEYDGQMHALAAQALR